MVSIPNMDILVANLTKANEAYRSGLPLLMTDDEYDAGMELLRNKVPNHPLLKAVRAPPSKGKTVRMPYYLGSLDKAKVAEELAKWVKKVSASKAETFLVSEKLDGISGLWNPVEGKLYLSGDDNMGLDVSAWLPHISKSPKLIVSVDQPVWIRGELIMPKTLVPEGKLGRSIVNGIFHHLIPEPEEAKKVRFVAYEVIGMASSLTMKQQFGWLEHWGCWMPWSVYMKTLSDEATLTKLLSIRRTESEYEMDGLVIRTNTVQERVVKGNPKDAIAWKPPNGETRLTKVVAVEWNTSSVGRLIPRVEIEAVQLGGSVIKYVSGVNARRILDWKIGPGASVIIRKGGDVIPVIDSVEVAGPLQFPPTDTWEWEGDENTAVNIRQKEADASTIVAQYTKMVKQLDWAGIGPSQIKSIVAAGYTTIPLLRKATEAELVKLLGKVCGARAYETVQTTGWEKASEIDLFLASPLCPSGIGKLRLEALYAVQPDYKTWSTAGSIVNPKLWSPDALKEFQVLWKTYETFRKEDWGFLVYPQSLTSVANHTKGTVVMTGFRDADLEEKLAAKGYKVVDTVKSDTKAVLIADKEDPLTYTSGKIEKAKKIPGCRILRRVDWTSL